jgi:hypothetical protein
MGTGCQRHALVVLTTESFGTHCIEFWVGFRACLQGRGKLAHTEIRSPDLSARSELLHHLRFPGATIQWVTEIKRRKFGTENQQRYSNKRKDILI